MSTIDDDGIVVASGTDVGVDDDDEEEDIRWNPVVSPVPLDFLRLRNHEDGDDVAAAVVVAEMCSGNDDRAEEEDDVE